jgi:hypothetical protein
MITSLAQLVELAEDERPTKVNDDLGGAKYKRDEGGAERKPDNYVTASTNSSPTGPPELLLSK